MTDTIEKNPVEMGAINRRRREEALRTHGAVLVGIDMLLAYVLYLDRRLAVDQTINDEIREMHTLRNKLRRDALEDAKKSIQLFAEQNR